MSLGLIFDEPVTGSPRARGLFHDIREIVLFRVYFFSEMPSSMYVDNCVFCSPKSAIVAN